MKVTALIEDKLIEDVKRVSGGKNITESITIAIKHYLNNQKLDYVIKELDKEPIQFNEAFSAYNIRKINRDL